MSVTNPQDRLKLEQHHCEFCSEFSGHGDNAFRALYSDTIPDRSVLATEQFRVFPSLGQIVEGYLLIAPVQHYGALCELPEDLLVDLEQLCSQTKRALAACYGNCIFYEHGTRLGGAGGCGIYHAHLHAVPLPRSVSLVTTLRSEFLSKRITGLTELKEQTSQMRGYVLYVDSDSKYYVFHTPDLPSQYMRRLLAQAIGASVWDWRSAGRELKLIATLNRVSRCFDRAAILAREACK